MNTTVSFFSSDRFAAKLGYRSILERGQLYFVGKHLKWIRICLRLFRRIIIVMKGD